MDSSANVFERQQSTFVEEAFRYLLHHYRIENRPPTNFTVFTEAMGHAIISIGYLFRRGLRSFFRSVLLSNLNSVDKFEAFAKKFYVIRDECYFYRILKRISHVFELTMFCLENDYNYIESARKLTTVDDDTIFFQNNGGWARLNDTATFLDLSVEYFYCIICDEIPRHTQLIPINEALSSVEDKPYFDSLVNMQKAFLLLLISDIKDKENILSNADRRIKCLFYNFTIEHSLKVYSVGEARLPPSGTYEESINFGAENEKQALVNLLESQLRVILGEVRFLYRRYDRRTYLGSYFYVFRYLTDLMSEEFETVEANPEPVAHSSRSRNNLNLLNKCFIVNEDCVLSKKRSVIRAARRGSAGNALVTDYLLLDANIEVNRLFQLLDGRYAVYTYDCTFDMGTVFIIVKL